MTKAEKRAAKAAKAAAEAAPETTVAETPQPETPAETVAETPQPETPPAEASAEKPTPKLEVKKGVVYRGARQAWYERLLTLEGKTRAEVMENLTANRPSVYGERSKHRGLPEPAPGWMRFFERTSVATFK
jgi:hypothetical protein